MDQSGNLWAWGWNGSGQLGNNSTLNSTLPLQVTGVSNIFAVAGGSFHTLALAVDGTVWAWGDNLSGEVGNNAATQTSLKPGASYQFGLGDCDHGTHDQQRGAESRRRRLGVGR